MHRFIFFAAAAVAVVSACQLAPFGTTAHNDCCGYISPGEADSNYFRCSSLNCPDAQIATGVSAAGWTGIDSAGSVPPGRTAWFFTTWNDPGLKYCTNVKCTISARGDDVISRIKVGTNPAMTTAIGLGSYTDTVLTGFSSGPGFAPNKIVFQVQDTQGGQLAFSINSVFCWGDDLDMCAAGACSAGTTCLNVPGSDPICTDINECASANGGCPAGTTCENTYGSRHCHNPTDCAIIGCPQPGYECVEGNNGVCTDVNECGLAQPPCGANAWCINTPGLFNCGCNAGFTGTPPGCADINECASNNGDCGPSAFVTCINNIGAPPFCSDINECASANGGCGSAAYVVCANNIGAAPNCSDINECASNNGGCSIFEACANRQGAAPVCTDVNECAVANGGCVFPFQSCANKDRAPPVCTNINECASANGGCGPYAYCVDYDDSLPDCFDINECATANGACGPYAYCANRILAAPLCTDINECTSANGGCSPAQECFNELMAAPRCVNLCSVNNGGCGSFAVCVDTGDDIACNDINECAVARGGCTAEEACFDQAGGPPICDSVNGCATANGGCSFAFSICFDGPNNVTCADINECAVGNGGCPDECLNILNGGFGCTSRIVTEITSRSVERDLNTIIACSVGGIVLACAVGVACMCHHRKRAIINRDLKRRLRNGGDLEMAMRREETVLADPGPMADEERIGETSAPVTPRVAAPYVAPEVHTSRFNYDKATRPEGVETKRGEAEHAPAASGAASEASTMPSDAAIALAIITAEKMTRDLPSPPPKRTWRRPASLAPTIKLDLAEIPRHERQETPVAVSMDDLPVASPASIAAAIGARRADVGDSDDGDIQNTDDDWPEPAAAAAVAAALPDGAKAAIEDPEETDEGVAEAEAVPAPAEVAGT